MPQYRSDIDGLRAVAVLPVVLFHAKIPGFGGGYVGVDVFFVISGFLITSIIHREIENNQFSLIHFYERRARRILPALFAMVAVSCVAAAFLLFPDQYESFSKSVLATALFVSSITFYRESGYFDIEAEQKPLLHTWSLSVEEIFYVVFPLLLLAIAYWVPRRRILVLSLLGLCSFAISVIALNADPKSRLAFFLPHARAWEFLIGSLLAIAPARLFDRPRLMEAAAACGLVLILFAIFYYTAETTFPGVAALAPCLGTALIIAAGRQGTTTVGRLLSAPVLVYCGLISYSLYLWHWPMLVFSRAYVGGDLFLIQTAIVIVLSVAIAAFSLRFIERPFRGSASSIEQSSVFALSIAGIVGFVGIGLHGELTQGWVGRYPDDKAAIFNADKDRDPRRKECLSIASDAEGCIYGAGGISPTVALWGDSHAAHYAPMLGELAVSGNQSVLVQTMPSCPPVKGWALPAHSWRDACLKFQDRTLERLKSEPDLRWVVFAGRFGGYPFVDPKSDFRAKFEQTIRELKSDGKQVAIVFPTPYHGEDTPLKLKRQAMTGKAPDVIKQPRSDFFSQFVHEMKFLTELAEKYGLTTIKPHQKMCDDQACYFYKDGIVYFHDSHHLSLSGARQLKPLFSILFESE